MKIDVVEVISDLNIGGAGKLLLTRFSVLDRDNFSEEIVLPYGSELYDEFIRIGFTPICVRNCDNKSFDIRAVWGLYKYFKSRKPDVVNSHGCLSSRIAAFFARVPVKIYTRHCAFNISVVLRSFISKKIIKIFTNITTDKIIAVADAARDNLLNMGINGEIIETIINGVTPIKKYSNDKKIITRSEFGIPAGAFVCGMSTRLEDCKGVDVFIRAARKLLQKSTKYYFMVVGKGSMEEELKILVDVLGISKHFVFCGFVSDITPYINCFNVFVNCSRGTETSSLSLSEAMSIGLPCVVSDWGGNPYMVRDGYNGFVYPTDNFISLCDCIEKLRNDVSLYNVMSANAYNRYAEELTAENMARKTETLYRNCFLAINQNNNIEGAEKN